MAENKRLLEENDTIAVLVLQIQDKFKTYLFSDRFSTTDLKSSAEKYVTPRKQQMRLSAEINVFMWTEIVHVRHIQKM